MLKKKAITVMVAGLSSALLITACGDGEENNNIGDNTGDNNVENNVENNAGNEANAGDGEEKVIDFMHLWPQGSSAEHYAIVEDIVADFESANPNITVDVDVMSNEQYKDQMTILGSSNELPDVGMTWPAGYLEPFVEGNMFAPLNDLVEGDLAGEFVAGTAEAYEWDGNNYGLPLELNAAYVFYNKAIFDEHGLEAPETMDELDHIVDTLNDAGIEPIALGNRDRWTGSLWYMYLADRISGEDDKLTEAITREGSFEDPALIQAAEEVQRMVDNGAFINGFNGLADEEAKSMFMNEQTGMYLIATWDLPNYTTNEDVPQEFRDSIDYFKFPTVGGEGDMNSMVGGPGVGLFVSEDSDVKEEAKEFSSYFVQEWGERSVQEAGVIPATIVDTEAVELPEMYLDVLADLDSATNLTLFADVQMSPAAASVHLDAIQALFGGEITPEEFAELHEEALAEEE
ncbi:extracellular solute-binding protein [Salipaludibacillus sp. HK11]|uniref:extracellular solute-binding protein n=1 Tax=Salipaludibacillus sp. HK11 TaxID=3394320 RepID=UPI0039FC5EF6